MCHCFLAGRCPQEAQPAARRLGKSSTPCVCSESFLSRAHLHPKWSPHFSFSPVSLSRAVLYIFIPLVFISLSPLFLSSTPPPSPRCLSFPPHEAAPQPPLGAFSAWFPVTPISPLPPPTSSSHSLLCGQNQTSAHHVPDELGYDSH